MPPACLELRHRLHPFARYQDGDSNLRDGQEGEGKMWLSYRQPCRVPEGENPLNPQRPKYDSQELISLLKWTQWFVSPKLASANAAANKKGRDSGCSVSLPTHTWEKSR